MNVGNRALRGLAHALACALLLSIAPPSVAQQSATPLPPVDVIAKQAAPKKKQTKAPAPKAAPKAAAAPAESAPQDAVQGRATASSASPVKDYVAQDSALGTKTDTPLKETPQSISVVGREQMRDQGVQSVQEAVRYVPGVLADGFGYDSRGDYSIIRGIPAAYFVDGLRTGFGSYSNTTAIEPYALERIEVLRGPASMLYGQVPTGGIISGTSKLPLDIPYNEIGVEYGSFDFKQVKFDSSGPLTSDGKWLYRVVGLARDADTQVDFVENDRIMIAPSLTYRPTNDTSITLLGNYRNDETGSTQQFLPQIGTMVPNINGQRMSHSTFIGEPGDYYNTEAASASLLIDHKFSDALKLHHGTRYSHTDNDYDSTYAAVLTPTRFSVINQALTTPPPNGFGLPYGIIGTHAPFLNADQSEIARARSILFNETEVFNSDTNLTGKFKTGWIDHKVTGGVDYTYYGTDQTRSDTLIDNILTGSSVDPAWPADPAWNWLLPGLLQPSFNIYNPKYGQSTHYFGFEDGLVPANAIPLHKRPHEAQIQKGIYIQDQLRMGPWISVLGLRQDWLTIEQKGSSDEHETATTGRAALMYEFDFGLTPYISYSTSFSAQPGNPVGDNIFASFTTLTPAGPLEGEQVELGFKYQPHGVPLMINAALYQLFDRNQIVQPDVLFSPVQGADIKVRGFEIEAVGKITPEIKIIGSYSYAEATFDKYPELYGFPSGIAQFMEGKPVDGIPKHLASLWGIYSVQYGPLKGLSFGAGVRYVGESESYGREISTLQEIHVKTPSYALFDAMVAYETPDWRWQLTAQNLEDEFYVTSCTAYRGDCGVGQARTIITGFTYKF